MATTCFVIHLNTPQVHFFLSKLALFHFNWYGSSVVLVGTEESNNSEDYEHISEFLLSDEETLRKVLGYVKESTCYTADVVCGAFLGIEAIRANKGEMKKKLKTNISQ